MIAGYVLFFIGLVLVLVNFALPLPFGIIVGLIGVGALGGSVYLLIHAARNSKGHS